MAKYTGNLTDFLRYVGPLTRNIVSNLSRKYKKHTTCYHKDCGKWKLLEAAHIKGFERPTIIANILEEYKQGDDYYEIDLNEFKEKFILAHTPIENVILPMCKKHHLEYDNENKINQEYPVIINEFIDEEDNTDYSVEELIELEENEIKAVAKEIKSTEEIFTSHNIVNKKQTSFSRISESNGCWNFDVDKEKFKNDFHFIFNSPDKVNIALIKANSLDLNIFLKKGEKYIRFVVSTDFQDKHSSFDFKPYLI